MKTLHHICMARDEYERTRYLVAFTVRGHRATSRNQHAAVYYFSDGSEFICYGRHGEGGAAYRGKDGAVYARRNGMGGRVSVELDAKECRRLGLK